MTFDVAETAILERFEAAWHDLFPDVGVFKDNERNQLPAGPYVHIVVVDEGERIAAIGGGRGKNEWSNQGRVEIRIFVPLFAGRAYLRNLEREAAGIFRGQAFSNTQFYGAFPSGAGERADRGNVFMSTVLVDFVYRHVG